MNKDTGLVIVFTGDGKGKTSAALGMALRAAGHGMRISMVQFIKSRSDTGEAMAADLLKPAFELVTVGKGFVMGKQGAPAFPEHVQAAQHALELARQRSTSGYWDILVLDEINNAVALGLVAISDVLDLIRSRSPKLHIVLTGRDAHPDLVARADMVTEMRSLKHPYERGIPAARGIDF